MSATFGASAFSLTMPTGGTIEESSLESECEIKTIKNLSGITCRAIPGKIVTQTETLKGRGTAPITGVTGGEFTSSVMKITSIKNTESNDDFPTYEITAKSYATIS